MSVKYKSLEDFFTAHISNIEADKKLTKKLRNFRLTWSTKNDDYINFLSSKLLGVHTVRFSTLDDDVLMMDTLKVHNYKHMQQEIFELEGMEKNFKVGSNIIYQTLLYIIFKYRTNKKLSDKDRVAGMREACLIMQHKMFSSLLAWYFKFNTTDTIARTVYDNLSNKFLIKELDDWNHVFEYRAATCTDKDGVNYNRMVKYDVDASLRIIPDIQIKLREQVKQIWLVFKLVRDEKLVVNIESSLFTGGENNEEQMRALDRGVMVYVHNLKNAALNENDFIDTTVLDITSSLFNNVKRSTMFTFLKSMTDNNFIANDKHNEILEKSLVESFTYLTRSKINIEDRSNLGKALIAIRQYWSSSNVKNKDMENIKDELNRLAFKSTGRKTSWLLVSLSLAYITYTFLRSLKQ